MDVEQLRQYCLSKKGAAEGLPFDDVTLVFKVMGKIFAATGLEAPECRVNLKCDPERAVQLREEYADIIPGYHMHKKHWNTVYCERELEAAFLEELIDHSYELVVAGLRKKDQEALKMM